MLMNKPLTQKAQKMDGSMMNGIGTAIVVLCCLCGAAGVLIGWLLF